MSPGHDRENISGNRVLRDTLLQLQQPELSPFDFLPQGSIAERVISLVLDGLGTFAAGELADRFRPLIADFAAQNCEDVKVVVFGGGTGLSNIVGGDSRRATWPASPFTGLKELFPQLHSVVCVTDDGGSTGELQKDLPLIALGDLRHVLLSSIRRQTLKERYGLDESGAGQVAAALYMLFNHRFSCRPESPGQLILNSGAPLLTLPSSLRLMLEDLLSALFTDSRLAPTLDHSQCLGNLLLASCVYRQLDRTLSTSDLVASYQVVRTATIRGLAEMADAIGAQERSVLPCTTTISQLQMLYANGVLVTGESKSEEARRGYPVDRVRVKFCRKPFLPPEVLQLVRGADILLFAPGSLYTSIIPILQVPGLAEAVRSNAHALKLLVANIWVQKGETDVARDAPDRKFYVSDLILAYHRNIPDGVHELFSHVLSLNLGDIPGSVLQRYAIEDKEPIYLDRERVADLGFSTIEACIFSKDLMRRSGVIQHDPAAMAKAVHTLWGLKKSGFLPPTDRNSILPPGKNFQPSIGEGEIAPCIRYRNIQTSLNGLSAKKQKANTDSSGRMNERERRQLFDRLGEIIWNLPDIPSLHLEGIQGVTLVDSSCWKRCQEWDNVFSFYDPADGHIKIRRDLEEDRQRFETAFLVALGQSLLGNYAAEKYMQDISTDTEQVGHMFCLQVHEAPSLKSFLTREDIHRYLILARMRPSTCAGGLYTRVVNNHEGFTPPGLLFGLLYAWYLDNRFVANIEYKMSIMRNELSHLIPEQVRIFNRRKELIHFFRESVFQHRLNPVTAVL